MNRKEFLEQLDVVKKQQHRMSKDDIKQTLKKSVNTSAGVRDARGQRSAIIAIQELNELSVELTNWLRGKDGKLGLLEEMADVQIVLYTMQEFLGITDEELEAAIDVKMRRINHTIDCNGTFS